MTPVERLLRERLAREGPLSFAEVMGTALYHPEHGYYSRLRGFGAAGDFITSPETHPLFGWLLGRQAVDLWVALGRPEPLRILEYGGGSGALAEALLGYPDLPQVEYLIDEPSPSLREIQQQRLGERLTGQPSGAPHLVIANEVLDALPVHRVTVRDGHLRELLVGADFEWVEANASPALEKYFARLGLQPAEGSIAEVSLELETWVQTLARRLEHGLALVLDYGAPAEQLFARPGGNLQTYFRHTLGADPLQRLGEQDISVHVDFSTLATSAVGAGLQVKGVTSQQTLLSNLGLAQLDVRSPTDRQALGALVDPNGLGRIGALFLGRGLSADYIPAGLAGQRQWSALDSARVPMLPPGPDDDAFFDLWNEAFSGHAIPD